MNNFGSKDNVNAFEIPDPELNELIFHARNAIVAVGRPTLETFVPLYLTNYCDGLCRVCNMRANNHALKRIQGSREEIGRQLEIIRNVEGISAVCFLTGEYHFESQARKKNLELVLWSITEALGQGFEKIYFNIGALTDQEINVFHRRFERENRLVLSLFQETYNRACYERFFGAYKEQESPKADYDLRLSTPWRWISAGFKQVDIGILLGLKPPSSDVEQLIEHARMLHKSDASIAISLPRLRGLKKHPEPLSDEHFMRIVATVAAACPWARVIITTRESIEIIKKLLPITGIVSPGTSDVLPYTVTGPIPNRQSTSQFQVAPIRPRPSWVLNDLGLEAHAVEHFRPRQ